MYNIKKQKDNILNKCCELEKEITELNEEIANQMRSNDNVIANMMNENRELAIMQSDNNSLLKSFSKLLKKIKS